MKQVKSLKSEAAIAVYQIVGIFAVAPLMIVAAYFG
jgi:hypothetical protein